MKKIRLTMKLLLFFSLALVLNTSAIPSKAQQTKVSLNLKDKRSIKADTTAKRFQHSLQ
jgi:hypothetical protein